MELKLKQLLNGIDTLRHLANSRGLKARVSYQISRNVKSIDEELTNYDNIVKQTCEKYAVLDDEGKPVYSPEGNAMYSDNLSLTKEIEELQETVVDIDISPIPIDALDVVELTPNDMI